MSDEVSEKKKPMRTCRKCGSVRPADEMKVAGGSMLRWMEFVCAKRCKRPSEKPLKENT